MKQLKWFALLLTLAFFTACAENDGESASNDFEGALNEAAETAGIKSVDTYNGKLDQLLTLPMAAAATGKNAEEATPDYDQFMENPAYHAIAYAWKGDRMLETDLGFTKIETPKDDIVSLRWVQSSDLKTFQANYRQPTEEDYKRLDKALDDKVKEENMSSESAAIAKDLASGIGSNIQREPVQGIGEAAVWESNSGILYVYQKGISFQIHVDVSSDMAVNRTVAMELANGVITKL